MHRLILVDHQLTPTKSPRELIPRTYLLNLPRELTSWTHLVNSLLNLPRKLIHKLTTKPFPHQASATWAIWTRRTYWFSSSYRSARTWSLACSSCSPDSTRCFAFVACSGRPAAARPTNSRSWWYASWSSRCSTWCPAWSWSSATSTSTSTVRTGRSATTADAIRNRRCTTWSAKTIRVWRSHTSPTKLRSTWCSYSSTSCAWWWASPRASGFGRRKRWTPGRVSTVASVASTVAAPASRRRRRTVANCYARAATAWPPLIWCRTSRVAISRPHRRVIRWPARWVVSSTRTTRIELTSSCSISTSNCRCNNSSSAPICPADWRASPAATTALALRLIVNCHCHMSEQIRSKVSHR